MSRKIAVFPGSFDPITIGHTDVVHRALPLFDELIVAVGVNTQKKYLFELERRIKWLKKVFANEKKIKVEHYEGLTINYCKKIGAQYIIRGIRSATDFEYEKTIAHLNRAMYDEVETLLILARPELTAVSSTIVREIIIGGGDTSKFLPKEIEIEKSLIN